MICYWYTRNYPLPLIIVQGYTGRKQAGERDRVCRECVKTVQGRQSSTVSACMQYLGVYIHTYTDVCCSGSVA